MIGEDLIIIGYALVVLGFVVAAYAMGWLEYDC